MKFLLELSKVEELILEYALDNNFYQVIQAFSTTKEPDFFLNIREKLILDIRMFCSTISFIVENEDVQNFHKVIEMLLWMNEKEPEAVSSQRFSQVIIALKIKALVHDIISEKYQFSELLTVLENYFPAIATNNQENHGTDVDACRKILISMICSQSEERNRIKARLEKKYDRKYMKKFQKSLSIVLKKFKATLPIPILHQIVIEQKNSQIHGNLSSSPNSLLDDLVRQCFRGVPSEDSLLLILNKVWGSMENSSQQTQCIGESQMFDLLCSNLATQESQEVGFIVEPPPIEGGKSESHNSNASSFDIVSSSIKSASDRSANESSESSKSISLISKNQRIELKKFEHTAETKQLLGRNHQVDLTRFEGDSLFYNTNSEIEGCSTVQDMVDDSTSELIHVRFIPATTSTQKTDDTDINSGGYEADAETNLSQEMSF